jgi:hypothetical protein
MIVLLTDPRSRGLKRRAERWAMIDWNDGFLMVSFCISALVALCSIITLVAFAFGAQQDVSTWIVCLGFLPLALFGLGVLTAAWGNKRSFYLERNSSDTRFETVRQGVQAYRVMEPALHVEAFPVYRNMYSAMARYKIAEEPAALLEAAKRGQLLKDIHEQGKLTRAAHIALDDDTDLDHGRAILSAMKSVRKEITDGRSKLL